MDRPLQQSDEFRAALALAGVPHRRAHGVVMIERRLPFLGPVGLASRARFDAAAMTALRRAGLRLVNAEEEAGWRQAGFVPLWTPAHVAELDITGGQAAREARMKGKWRNRLRRAQDARMTVAEIGWTGAAHPLIDRAAAQAKARGYRGLPAPLIAAYAATNPGKATIFEARADGEVIAAMLFLRHGSRATYQVGWTGETGRALGAHNRLLALAAGRLAERGVGLVELGLVETERNPGLARFKLGAGAVPRALGGTWLALPRPTLARSRIAPARPAR